MTEAQADGSALVVEIPRAEPILEPWRARHDPVAALGIPAHVTLLFPFVPPPALDTRIERELATFARRHPPFEVRFTDVGRFPDAVWLSPEPGSGFDALIADAIAAFPAYPPYAGRFPDQVAHLTIGQGTEAEMDALFAQVTASLVGALPIRANVDRLSLFITLGGRWARRATYPLG